MKISGLVAWYDLWIGAFWDSKKRWLYILPLPCIGVIIKFKPRLHEDGRRVGQSKLVYDKAKRTIVTR